MTGWDARPWNTPPTWYFNPTRTPDAVGAHLQKAIDWIDDNPTLATPERLVMIYAWNEFGEGGYITPTVGDPDGLYLDAIKSVVLVPEPGDANGDGKVDSADLATWQQNYDPLGENQNTFDMGDWSGDGLIDSADLALWQQNYDPIGPGGLGAAHTPEPATLLLLVVGGVVLLKQRR
jgi:hypothetical protein